MKREYGAKFLAVDVAHLQVKLTKLGAIQVLPPTLVTSRLFEYDALGGAWLRLREERTRSILTLKHVADATKGGTTETEVADLHAMVEILRRLGLREARYQEHYREKWRLGEADYSFDTWPDLSTFLEIEAPDEASIRQAAALLELDFAEACFGSMEEIYESEAGRNILGEPTLLFSNAVRIQPA
ncbi:CYTH domain-containing protein [Streptomyces sp. NPDC058622]|uniref:CYTH domain-containing protein n=1 Tax=Streptomyces sp. NPDC058622 TaxID=3346562 RepID=UPI003659C3D5